jgi:hypothetical protein
VVPGGQALALAAQAREAFVGAMHVTLWAGIGVLLLGALTTLAWVPDRVTGTGSGEDLTVDGALAGEAL